MDDYDPLYGVYQPDDVLRGGLPPLPTGGIEAGSTFPLAVWKSEAYGAVLYVHHRLHGYEDETVHLVRGDDGPWHWCGSGGDGWVNVFDPPKDLLERHLVIGTGVLGSGGDADTWYTTGGMCSSVVAAIETADSSGTHVYPVDPGHPFFLAGIVGPGRVRVLGSNGEALAGEDGEPLGFETA